LIFLLLICFLLDGGDFFGRRGDLDRFHPLFFDDGLFIFDDGGHDRFDRGLGLLRCFGLNR